MTRILDFLWSLPHASGFRSGAHPRLPRNLGFGIHGMWGADRLGMILIALVQLTFAHFRLGAETPRPAAADKTNSPGVFDAHPGSPGNNASIGQKEKTSKPSVGPTNSSGTGSESFRAGTMDDLDDKHKLAIGDKLSFRIVEDQEDPKPMAVTDSGDVEVPYIGRVPAENKTCRQLAREIKSALEEEYYYQATVILAVDFMTKSRGKVYLVGPVRAPGPQDIPSDEVLTLSKAIMRAGGFGDFADKKHVQVTRQGAAAGGTKQTYIQDVEQVLEKGKTEKDLPLEPGDLILIPERLVRF